MLSRDARYPVARLPSTVGAVTSGTDMRVQFLSHPEMLSRAIDRLGIRIQAGKIIRQHNDVVLIAERGMRRYNLHRRVHPRSRSKQGQLFFQVTPLLSGKVRDGTVHRAPGLRRVAHATRSIEATSFLQGGGRVCHTKDCKAQYGSE